MLFNVPYGLYEDGCGQSIGSRPTSTNVAALKTSIISASFKVLVKLVTKVIMMNDLGVYVIEFVIQKMCCL